MSKREIFIAKSAEKKPEAPILVIDPGGHKALIRDVIFTKDGKYLVSASDDKTVRIWDVVTGETQRIIRGQIDEGAGEIFAAALSKDNEWLAVGGWLPGDREEICSIRLYHFSTGRLMGLLKGHTNVVQSLAFSNDSQYLASGSLDKTVRIWDISKRQCLRTLFGHKSHIYGLSFLPDNRRVVSGSFDNTLILWDAITGQKIRQMSGHEDKVTHVAVSPDGKTIASGSWDKTIRLFNGRDGSFIKILARQETRVQRLSFSPDGRQILTGSGSLPVTCHLFSVPSGLNLHAFTQHENIVPATSISPDGRLAATGGGDNSEIYLWDTMSGEVKQRLVGKGSSVWSVGFGKDSASIAWGNKKDYQNSNSRGPLQTWLALSSNRDSSRIEFKGPLKNKTGFMRAIEKRDGYELKKKEKKRGEAGLQIILQIIKNGKLLAEIERDRASGYDHLSYTLTPDNQYVVSGGRNGSLILYETQTGRKVHEFIGHISEVLAVAVSPDGTKVVSGSSDQTVRVWSLKTAENLLTLFAGSDGEWAAWTPAGYYTASPYGDRFIGWQINNGPEREADYYSAFQFERILYQPDYVAAFVRSGGDEKAAAAALAGEFFDIRKLQTIVPPQIDIIAPAYGSTLAGSSKADLKFSIKSRNLDILDYAVFVNNIPVTPSRERILSGNLRRSFEKQVEIPLFAARNAIRIEAFNGKSMGLAETLVYAEGARQEQIKGDLYLLAIGVNKFTNMPQNNLDYAASDAGAIVAVFAKAQKKYFRKVFAKTVSDYAGTKPLKADIIASLDFLKQTRAEDTVVIFLASHGISDNKGNYYFVPKDASANEVQTLLAVSRRSMDNTAFKTDSLIRWDTFFDTLRSIPGKRLLVVDTCQAQNIAGTFDMYSLAKRSASSSIALLAASKGDEQSQEYEKGKQGLFTYALVQGLSGKADANKNGGIELKELYDFITRFVESNRDMSIGPQTPQLTTPDALANMVLTAFYVAAGADAVPASDKPFKNSIGMEFMHIKSGSFKMGSPPDETKRNDDEKQHQVTLSKGFYIQTTEVTVGQWREFVRATGYLSEAEKGGGTWIMAGNLKFKKKAGYNWSKPGFEQSDEHPVTCVSWNDTREFIQWLNNKREGKYRLPTEAEWEYVARSGSTTAFADCDISNTSCKDPIGWYLGNAGRKTHQVAQKEANAWGLYDMYGNVGEWVEDWYGKKYYSSSSSTDPKGPASGSHRVCRGCTWFSPGWVCRSANRVWDRPGSRHNGLGFRLALSPGL